LHELVANHLHPFAPQPRRLLWSHLLSESRVRIDDTPPRHYIRTMREVAGHWSPGTRPAGLTRDPAVGHDLASLEVDHHAAARFLEIRHAADATRADERAPTSWRAHDAGGTSSPRVDAVTIAGSAPRAQSRYGPSPGSAPRDGRATRGD